KASTFYVRQKVVQSGVSTWYTRATSQQTLLGLWNVNSIVSQSGTSTWYTQAYIVKTGTSNFFKLGKVSPSQSTLCNFLPYGSVALTLTSICDMKLKYFNTWVSNWATQESLGVTYPVLWYTDILATLSQDFIWNNLQSIAESQDSNW